MENTAEAPTGPRQTTEHLDTEEQHAFRLRARDYMAGRLPPRIPGEPANAFEQTDLVAKDRRTQRLLWDGGLAGITVPREYGGQGLDRRFEDIFHEEAEPYRLAWHFGNAFNIALPVLLANGTEEQKTKYIPRMLSGEQMWAQLLSEPSGGSDLAGLLTRAEKRGDKWVLNGSKIWTSGGHHCEMGLCLARTDATVRKHAGITAFLVDMHAPGMTINPIRLVRGGSEFCQEFLDDVEVSDADRIGPINEGWTTVAQTQLASERAGMARGWHAGIRPAAVAEHLILSQTPLRVAREVGRADDPAARELVGEALVLDAVYNLTGRRIGTGMRNGTLPSSVGTVHSLMAARTDIRRTALLSALTGPAGVASAVETPAGHAGIARVVTHRIGGGTLEMQLNVVAERHLGLPREPSIDRDIPFNQIKTNAAPKR